MNHQQTLQAVIDAGCTRSEVAAEIGVTPSAVSHWLTGLRQINQHVHVTRLLALHKRVMRRKR